MERNSIEPEQIPEPNYFSVINILYVGMKAKDLRIRNKTPYRNGQLAEDPLDLVLSVEITAKRVLSNREYGLWIRFSAHSAEAVDMLLPAETKGTLRNAWKPIYYDFPVLRQSSEHASALHRAYALRQATRRDKAAKALDQGLGTDLYSAEEQQQFVDEAEAKSYFETQTI